MATKTPVTLIQDATGQVRRVRVGETEFAVMSAGPIVVGGGLGIALTIENADVRVEPAAPPADAAPTA